MVLRDLRGCIHYSVVYLVAFLSLLQAASCCLLWLVVFLPHSVKTRVLDWSGSRLTSLWLYCLTVPYHPLLLIDHPCPQGLFTPLLKHPNPRKVQSGILGCVPHSRGLSLTQKVWIKLSLCLMMASLSCWGNTRQVGYFPSELQTGSGVNSFPLFSFLSPYMKMPLLFEILDPLWYKVSVLLCPIFSRKGELWPQCFGQGRPVAYIIASLYSPFFSVATVYLTNVEW